MYIRMLILRCLSTFGQGNEHNATDGIPPTDKIWPSIILHRYTRFQRLNAPNPQDSFVRRKRETLYNELSDDVVLIIPKPHPEYDLETRLKLGQDAKIRVNASPVSPAHGRAQVGGTRTIWNRNDELFECWGVDFPKGSVQPVRGSAKVFAVDLEFEFLEYRTIPEV